MSTVALRNDSHQSPSGTCLPATNLKAGDNTITTTSGSWMVCDALGLRQLP